ncbi:MAG: acid phosphatase [Chitinophagaceae bacterium]|nr:MAG: acid phosphatase [Chitinophagaceae bacterium]
MLPHRLKAVLLLIFLWSDTSAGPLADSIPGLRTPDSSVSFLVLGDWGRNGSPVQQRVAGKMAEAAEQVGASFVVVTGDNFYDNGVRDTADAQWKTSFENVYTAPSLQVPWYVVLGNHDYHLNPDAQVMYTLKNTRWQMPQRYYSVSVPVYGDTLLFLFIDTDPIEKDFLGRAHDSLKYPENGVALQLEWMEKTLAASRAKWKVVVGHHPPHTGGARRHSSRTRKMRSVLQPLFYRHGVDFYISGHEHHLEYLKPRKGPTHYIISGAGSEARHVGWLKRYRQFAARKKGFALLSIGNSVAQVNFIDQSGRLLFSRQFRK